MDAIEKRNHIITSAISPFLKENGFKKRGRYQFAKNGIGDEITIEVINSRWNDKNYVKFEFEIWFYFKPEFD
ncbi:MAG: hypothetical protein ACI8ZN_000780 [Bacteroidia bacterium]|jgi:hypothetical protein